MRKVTFRKIRGLLGIIIVIASMLLVYTWEIKGRESFLYTNIVVLNTDVYEGQIVKADMLSYISMDNSKLIEGVITDPNSIIDKAAKHYIPKGTQLTANYFEDSELILDEDEYIFKIPSQWILSMPETIRRKDTAYFYVIKDSVVRDLNNNDADSFYEYVSEKPLVSFTVAYVKDSSNQEVTNVGNDRFNSTSKVVSLEVIANEEKINLLKKYAENGNKFVIAYN